MNNRELPKGMPDKEADVARRIESFVRRFFERLGGALDFALRRPLNPQPRTDVTALIPQLERAIEENLRREGGRVAAPNLIELRYDYETYSRLTGKRRDFLERELRATVYEFIHNRRYQTLGDVQVKIAFDVFARRLTIKARFPDEAVEAAVPSNQSAEPPPTAALPVAKRAEIILKSRSRELRATINSGGDRVSIGRSHDNALVVEDATVSNVHAAFTLGANGTLWLADLSSSNGTSVNGVRLSVGDKSIVKAGDKLQFGEVIANLEILDKA